MCLRRIPDVGIHHDNRSDAPVFLACTDGDLMTGIPGAIDGDHLLVTTPNNANVSRNLYLLPSSTRMLPWRTPGPAEASRQARVKRRSFVHSWSTG
jgi:hypothetical protein